MKIQPQPPKQRLTDALAAEEQRAARARSKGQGSSPAKTSTRSSQAKAGMRANIVSQNKIAANSAPRTLEQAGKAISKVVKDVKSQPQAARSAHQGINRESVLTLLKR